MIAASACHSRSFGFVMVAVACTACARDEQRSVDSASAPSVAAPASVDRGDSGRLGSTPRATVVGQKVTITPTCVSEGAWQPCNVERRLIDAGFVLLTKGPAPGGVFPVPGASYALGAAELHVYLFTSAKARESAIAGIDTVAIAPRGGVAVWPTPHTLITSNNLVAVLISDNDRLVERVQNAITAGLPAAAR